MKLGLIAMSGVRCYNKELMEYGLTLPGFLERSQVIASLPSLGLLTLAGMTPDDFEVEYVEVPDPDSLGDTLPGEFDVVAISSFTSMIRDAYAIADRYRAAGTTVILGGLHVTLMPDEAAQHADIILIGEAEPLWESILEDVKKGTALPRYDARATTFDFANSPMPRFDLLDISKIQSPDRSDPKRLPIRLRILCCVHPPQSKVPYQACRSSHCRDPCH